MSAQVTQPGDPHDPVLAQRNLRLGVILGCAVIGVVGVFMWRFSTVGLPPDAKMVKAREQRESAENVPVEIEEVDAVNPFAAPQSFGIYPLETNPTSPTTPENSLEEAELADPDDTVGP